MFTRILVPLDGTSESNAALPLARTLARATGGSITLLRVLPPGDSSGDRAMVAEIKDNLDRVAAELASSGIQLSAIVRQGDPSDEIESHVRAEGTELIIMRTHGRAGIGRAVLGSVAEKVLTASHIPIVLMRPGGRRISHLKRLLVPVDGSPGGAVALGTAIGLAKQSGATIRLLQAVVPIPMQAWAGYSGLMYYDPAWDEEARTSAQNYVSSMLARLRESGLEASAAMREGPVVADTIVVQAEADAADLIVMSTHALTGIARAVLGSVADAVVRTANCPVLLIRRVENAPGELESNTPASQPATV